MKNLAWLFFLVACGCQRETESADQPEPIHPWAFMSPAAETEDGILIFVHSGDQNYNPEDINTWFIDVKQCLQMEAPPPVIRYSIRLHELCNNITAEDEEAGTAGGAFCNNNNGLGWFIAMRSDHADMRGVTKHEMIHWVREMNEDIAHRNHDGDPTSALWQCQYN